VVVCCPDSQTTDLFSDILGPTLGLAVEQALFAFCHRDTGPEYKGKFRELNSNLKDPKNPQLKQRVLSGELTPAALVKLTEKACVVVMRCGLFFLFYSSCWRVLDCVHDDFESDTLIF
jgi:hypothetical protein